MSISMNTVAATISTLVNNVMFTITLCRLFSGARCDTKQPAS